MTGPGIVEGVAAKAGGGILAGIFDALAAFFVARSPAFQAQAAQNAKLLADSRAEYTSLEAALEVAKNRIAAYDTERTRLNAKLTDLQATLATLQTQDKEIQNATTAKVDAVNKQSDADALRNL